MSKPKPHDMHVQCKLTKPTPEGNVKVTYSWLPEKYAKVGKVVRLKDDGKWEDGWTVAEAWGKRRSTDVIAQMEFFKSHRDGTDRYRGEDGEWVTRKEKVS